MGMDVTSFSIDHNKLRRGIYVSRIDAVGEEYVTTFDIRMKEPNREPVMDNPIMHTLEHLMAVYLRSEKSGWADQVLYIGPMGCRTGMYLLLKGKRDSQEIAELIRETFRSIVAFEGVVPYTEAVNCGNHLDHNLVLTQWEARKFLAETLDCLQPENLVYPD